jgi:hypothetical protein
MALMTIGEFSAAHDEIYVCLSKGELAWPAIRRFERLPGLLAARTSFSDLPLRDQDRWLPSGDARAQLPHAPLGRWVSVGALTDQGIGSPGTRARALTQFAPAVALACRAATR